MTMQKRSLRMDEHALNVQRIISVLGGTIYHMQDNIARTSDMDGICNTLMNKLKNIENMLLNPTPNTIKTGLSPNTNTTPVHFSGSAHATKDDISNIVLMISSDEDDEPNLPRKTRKQTENVVLYHDFGSTKKKSNGKSSIVGNNIIGSNSRGSYPSKI